MILSDRTNAAAEEGVAELDNNGQFVLGEHVLEEPLGFGLVQGL